MQSDDNYRSLVPVEVLGYSMEESQTEEGIESKANVFQHESLDSSFDTDPLKILKREHSASAASSSAFVGEYNEADFWNGTEEQLFNQSGTDHSDKQNIFTARNGCIWHTTKPATAANATTYAEEVLQPKGKGPAKLVSNVIEAWHLLLDQPILSHILRYTNERIKLNRCQKEPKMQERCTDAIELRAWLGLNYLVGIFRAKNELEHVADLEELWTPELGNSIFRATMSLNRFKFLSDCFSMGEPSRRDPEGLHEVQTIWEKFVINCRSYYAPSAHCVLTEHILHTQDSSCPLKFQLPEDETRTGIRLVSLHDAQTLYMCNAVITPTAVPTQHEVLTLACDIKGTQRTLTTSERYTTSELAQSLAQHRLQLVGALKTDAADAPLALDSAEAAPTAYYNDKLRLVTMQSAMPLFIMSSNLAEQLNLQRLYEATSQSAARFYRLADCYSCSAAVDAAQNETSYPWPLNFFHNVLNFACLNAWVLLRLSDNGHPTQSQRDFQRQLGLYLTQQHLKRRLQKNCKISLQLKLLIAEILGEPTETLLQEAVNATAQATSAGTVPPEKLTLPSDFQLLPKNTTTRKRCRGCPSKNNNKTRWQCQQCARVLCLKHMVMRCEGCTGVKLPPSNDDEEEFFK